MNRLRGFCIFVYIPDHHKAKVFGLAKTCRKNTGKNKIILYFVVMNSLNMHVYNCGSLDDFEDA